MNCDPREIARILDDIGDYSDEESVDQAEVNVRESANRQDFVQSNKENEMVTFNGHQFWKHYGYKQKMYWRCIKRITDGCPARLHTNSNTGLVLKIVGKHSNHGISAAAIVLRQLTQQVKEACTTTMEHPYTIFNNVLSGVPEAVQAKLDKSAIRKVVQRKQKLVNSEPEVPNGLNFVVPDGYRTYRFGLNDPELFLLGDQVYENNNRILLFGRASNKNWSAQMKVVFMDGTFKITPFPFYQVYVILAEHNGYVFPVLYALLVNKSRSTYEHLFVMVKEVWPAFSPSSVTVDFEIAAISALELCFPETEVWGCLFYLVQNLKKTLGKNGLKGRYETDADFAVKCRMITAMAFVKPEEVVPVFEEVWDLLPAELEPILTWMQKNYIGSISGRGVFVAPRFAHSLWNVYERTLNGDHRTNNFAESANHRIQSELDVCHPGLWKFINALRVVQQGRDQKFVQWQVGKRPKGKRSKYVEADRRILTIVEAYEERSTEEFLKGIAINYDMDD